MQTIIIKITRLYCLYFLEIRIRLSYNIIIALIENTILNFISAVFAKQSNGRKFEIDNLYIHCHVKPKNAPQFTFIADNNNSLRDWLSSR